MIPRGSKKNEMKKYTLLFYIVVIVILAGCSSDSTDEGNPIPPTPNVDISGNLLNVGDSANDILSNDNFDRIVVELAFATGLGPDQEAVDKFLDFLRRHTFKENIEIRTITVEPSGEPELTLDQIVELETQNRTVFNDGRTLGIYIYFADGPSANDNEDEGSVTLGAVYRNTSMVIYESTIRRLTRNSNVVTPALVEAATLTHEFGHLFGLVNLGTPAINDHEDPDAENHCNVPGCLMRAELAFGPAMMDTLEELMVNGLALPQLDPECVLDIQANGAR